MAISDKIKQHRKRLGITQRELAEVLGVSVQAVSKWETGSGIPDVTALIPLAKELHITTDELLDFHDRRQELEKLWQGVLRQYGDSSKELYDCACEALKEYPDDETFLYRRACNARFLYESMDASVTEKDRWFQIHEAQLFGLINKHSEWEWPISEMVYLLVAAGKKKEAMPYANRTKGETRSRLLKQCLEGDDLRHHRQSLVSKKLNELLCELRCDDPVFLDTIEQLIKALIPDGNYLYFHGHLMTVEIKRAEIAVLKKEYDRAISHLQQAFVYVRREDASPSGNFTCPIFSTIYYKCNRESGHPSLYEQFLHIVTSNKSLAPLRNRNAYKRLIHQAESCMEYSS